MRRGEKKGQRKREKMYLRTTRVRKREDAAGEKPMGVRVKKREREKGWLAEGRKSPGRESGRAGIVAPCLA